MLDSRWSKYRKPFVKEAYGIEIEMNNADEPYYLSFKNPFPFNLNKIAGFHVKQEPTADVEFVSEPETSERLKKRINGLYAALFPYRLRVGSNCGIHVHVSRIPSTDEHMWKIDTFLRYNYYDNFHQTAEIAGRRSPYGFGEIHEKTWEIKIWASSMKPEWACHCVDVAESLVHWKPKGAWTYDKFHCWFMKRHGRLLCDVRP